MHKFHLLFATTLVLATAANAGLVVTEVAGPPTSAFVRIQQTKRDETGPTSFRYYAPRTGEPTKDDLLAYDPNPARADGPIKAAAEAWYYYRDRDLGQTFKTGATGFKLGAITVRLQPVDVQGADPTGAKVSVHIMKVTGTPVVNDNRTLGGFYPGTSLYRNPKWATYGFTYPDGGAGDPNTPNRRPIKHYTDDFISGRDLSACASGVGRSDSGGAGYKRLPSLGVHGRRPALARAQHAVCLPVSLR